MPIFLNINERNIKGQGIKLTCPRYNNIDSIRRVTIGVTILKIRETRK